MDDKDTPNRASNMEKAEGDRTDGSDRPEEKRWRSEPDTVERQDRDKLDRGAPAQERGMDDAGE